MKSIEKAITRKYSDPKGRLVDSDDRKLAYMVLAFFIILGLEIYYKNRYEGNAFYLCGIWSWIFGVAVFIELWAWKRARAKIRKVYADRDDLVTESILLTDDYFCIEFLGFSRYEFQWSILVRYTETKKYIVINMGGTEFNIAKKHFSDEEIKEIFSFLEKKMWSKI